MKKQAKTEAPKKAPAETTVKPKAPVPVAPPKPTPQPAGKPALGVNELAALAYAKLREQQGGDAAGFPAWQQLLEVTRAAYCESAAHALTAEARNAFERHVRTLGGRQ